MMKNAAKSCFTPDCLNLLACLCIKSICTTGHFCHGRFYRQILLPLPFASQENSIRHSWQSELISTERNIFNTTLFRRSFFNREETSSRFLHEMNVTFYDENTLKVATRNVHRFSRSHICLECDFEWSSIFLFAYDFLFALQIEALEEQTE